MHLLKHVYDVCMWGACAYDIACVAGSQQSSVELVLCLLHLYVGFKAPPWVSGFYDRHFTC